MSMSMSMSMTNIRYDEGELKRSPGGLCCTKLAAAKLQWRDGFQVNHYSI